MDEKIEESCFWSIELIVCGQIERVIDKLLNVYNKNIHINNLLYLFFRFYTYLMVFYTYLMVLYLFNNYTESVI